MKALIMVDIQNDFAPGGALAVKDGDAIIPLVNKIQPYFECVLATQDWHPAHHRSFASMHLGKSPGSLIDLHGLPQILWPEHCVQHSHGAEFVQNLDMSRVQKIFHKGTDPQVDSYSGFFDNGHLKDTGLSAYLKGLGIKKVYLAGLATDYCVKFSALDAVAQGFETWVIQDACRAVNLQAGDGEAAWKEMERAGVKLISSVELLRPLSATP